MERVPWINSSLLEIPSVLSIYFITQATGLFTDCCSQRMASIGQAWGMPTSVAEGMIFCWKGIARETGIMDSYRAIVIINSHHKK